jgi:hypothetical protein
MNIQDNTQILFELSSLKRTAYLQLLAKYKAVGRGPNRLVLFEQMGKAKAEWDLSLRQLRDHVQFLEKMSRRMVSIVN